MPTLTIYTVDIAQPDWDKANDKFLDGLTSELRYRVEKTIQAVADEYEVKLQVED